jgi:hypothetical protein
MRRIPILELSTQVRLFVIIHPTHVTGPRVPSQRKLRGCNLGYDEGLNGV